jgi:putative ABC transport system substrate-binding protein
MKRREFIAVFGGTAVAWPFAVRAQHAERMRRIGMLMVHRETDPEFKNYLDAFRQGLQKLGWVEGGNIRIDTRWGALDDAEVREQSAKELLALQPDLILTQNTPPTASMLQQTHTIPIIFVIVADPVGSGFVASLPRPGGNVTGFTVMEATTAGKWLEVLKEIEPRLNRAAFLFNPATAPFAEYYLNPFKTAAASLGMEAIPAPVHDRSELESVIAAQVRGPSTGLIVMPDGFLNDHRAELVLLAARYRIPAIYPWRFFPELGGLLSYGSEQRDLFRLAATYVDRILKREAGRPAGAGTDQVRIGDQPENRQSAGSYRFADAARSGRRGDRIERPPSFLMSPFGHQTDLTRCPQFGRYRGQTGHGADSAFRSRLTHLYGPAVRCKPNVSKWRGLVLRICIRPLHGAFVLLAIMDIRAHPISFSERP